MKKSDVLAKCGTERDTIDIFCHLPKTQIRGLVRHERCWMEGIKIMEEHVNSNRFQHYVKVKDNVGVTYGRGNTRRDVVMRLSLGYKYCWQYKDV